MELWGALSRRGTRWRTRTRVLRAQALAPKVFDWLYLDAIVLQRVGRDEEAADQFRKALAISPGYLPAQVKLAEALLEIGRLDESKRLFESLRSDRLTEPFAAYGFGTDRRGGRTA